MSNGGQTGNRRLTNFSISLRTPSRLKYAPEILTPTPSSHTATGPAKLYLRSYRLLVRHIGTARRRLLLPPPTELSSLRSTS